MNDSVTSVSFLRLLAELDECGLKVVTDTWLEMSSKCPKLQKLVCNAENLNKRIKANKWSSWAFCSAFRDCKSWQLVRLAIIADP